MKTRPRLTHIAVKHCHQKRPVKYWEARRINHYQRNNDGSFAFEVIDTDVNKALLTARHYGENLIYKPVY